MTRRVDRVSEQLQHELGHIVAEELRDPRLQTLLTITHVVLSADLGHATVGVSVMGDPEQQQEAIRGMEAAIGFLRRRLAHRLRLRYVPQLRFALDTSLDEGDHVLSLMDQGQLSQPDVRSEPL
jgi:ribosome-binding factor A